MSQIVSQNVTMLEPQLNYNGLRHCDMSDSPLAFYFSGFTDNCDIVTSNTVYGDFGLVDVTSQM